MVINKHGSLVDTNMAGNGYHGRCEYCGLALVTDLGYTSWTGSKCISREVDDIPEEVFEKKIKVKVDSIKDNLHKKVSTGHGDGYICGFDYTRYLVKITKEYGKPILKSMFPDNILAYFPSEITLIL